MTANISKLSGSFLMTQVSMSKVSGVQNAQNDATSFSSFLKSDNSTANSNASVKKDVSDVSKLSSRPQADKTEKFVKKDETGKETDNAGEMINEAAQNVYDEIKEATGVDDEELNEAMEVLGITMVDLLQLENVGAIFEQVEKIEDPSILLTNEELSNSLSELLETTGEITDSLLQDLGMTKEEFDLALLSMAKNSENVSEEATEFAAVENNEEANKGLVVEVSDSRTVKNETTTERQEEKTGDKIENVVEQNSDRKVRKEHDGNENAMFSQNQQNSNAEFVSTVDNTTGIENYISTSTEEIVKQIVEQIKINITQSATTMQMELHPESLGHVALTIESKAGVITAQFSAQNEIVKEAIESQIVELKENIEAQGIKVEAVEVTVASHEFEQNLQQNNKGADENEAAQKVQKSGRRIRLNLSEDEEEELSEEEKITKEMMEENGNTIDFTA